MIAETHETHESCDNFLYKELQGHAFGAPAVQPWHAPERGRVSTEAWHGDGRVPTMGDLGWNGAPAVGGGRQLAPRLQRGGAPARAAAAPQSAPAPAAGGPRHHAPVGDGDRTSSRVVLPCQASCRRESSSQDIP
jgi:hypothetical protein